MKQMRDIRGGGLGSETTDHDENVFVEFSVLT